MEIKDADDIRPLLKSIQQKTSRGPALPSPLLELSPLPLLDNGVVGRAMSGCLSDLHSLYAVPNRAYQSVISVFKLDPALFVSLFLSGARNDREYAVLNRLESV